MAQKDARSGSFERKFSVPIIRTLDDVDLRGKRVLLRVDLNVPMADGEVGDPTRIERMAPTVAEIAAKGGKVILLSHFGRPKGRNAEDSLRPVAAALARHLGRDIAFADDCRAAPCLHRFGFAVSRIDVSQRLPVGVTDDIAAGHLVGVPRCGEAASPRCMLAKGCLNSAGGGTLHRPPAVSNTAFRRPGGCQQRRGPGSRSVPPLL